MNKLKGKKGFVAIKVDLSTTYDKLIWEFIWRALEQIKLSVKMVNVICVWLQIYVETNTKWNEVRFNFFHPNKEIRQGDHISPYVSVLYIDKLSHLISSVVDREEWKAIKMGRYGRVVSHLMFADDLLLFGKTTTK